MKRVGWAGLFAAAALLLSPAALADDTPYRTVVDSLQPKVAGVQFDGGLGGCDLVLTNSTAQEVILFDKAGKGLHLPGTRAGTPVRPQAVPLVGAWPCAKLPTVTEDQAWNRQPLTVLTWSVAGQVGSQSFHLQAHTDYDPALDPRSSWMYYVRIGGGLVAVAGLVGAGFYLANLRRQILQPLNTASSIDRSP